MKTILIFIGLKLTEIIGVLIALWLLGTASLFVIEFVGFSFPADENYFTKMFLSILLMIFFTTISIITVVGCYEWFKANWEKAKQISNK